MLYDRSELAGRVEHTLVRAVTEEVVVVVFVVLLFLLHPASALVPMVTLPFIVLLTFAALRLFGVPVTVMSLGGIAIALGMAVDADLVALEACHRRLEADGRRARRRPAHGAWSTPRPVARAGDPDVAAHRRAGVRAGVRVRRRDRAPACGRWRSARRWWCSRARSSR